LWHIFVCDL
jgi:hypothetical protein